MSEKCQGNKIHHLKTWSEFYKSVVSGEKTVEIRKDDRGFNVNDCLILQEWNEQGGYTGEAFSVRVTHCLRNQPWVPDGYVAMSIKPWVDDESSLEAQLAQAQAREAIYIEALEITKACVENEIGVREVFNKSLDFWPDLLDSSIKSALSSPSACAVELLRKAKVGEMVEALLLQGCHIMREDGKYLIKQDDPIASLELIEQMSDSIPEGSEVGYVRVIAARDSLEEALAHAQQGGDK